MWQLKKQSIHPEGAQVVERGEPPLAQLWAVATDGHKDLVELLTPVSLRDPSKEIYNRKGKLFGLTIKNEVTEMGVGSLRLKK